MNCPLPTIEWKYLINNLGEKEAYKVFIANGEDVPDYLTCIDIVNNIKSVQTELFNNLKYTPTNITSQTQIDGDFVFGSNTQGIHGLGSALLARQQFGAKIGQAEGKMGRSYGIITKRLDVPKSKQARSISLDQIGKGIQNALLHYKNVAPTTKAYFTKIGTMNAGYSTVEIRDLFQRIYDSAPQLFTENIILPKEFEIREAKKIVPVELTKYKSIINEIATTEIDKNTGETLLTYESELHYINVISAMLERIYANIDALNEKADAANQIKKSTSEIKNLVLNKLKSTFELDNVFSIKQKEVNTLFIKEIETNDRLWSKILKDYYEKSLVREKEEISDEDNIQKKLNDTVLASTEKTVSSKIKKVINRLKVFKSDINYLDYFKNNKSLPSYDASSISGLPEALNYNDVAGGIFRHYLGVVTNQEILERTAFIANYEPSFHELYDILSKDENALNLFAANFKRQFDIGSSLMLYYDRVTTKEDGRANVFEYKFANNYKTVVFNYVKGGEYTSELQLAISNANTKLTTLSSEDKDEAIELILDIFYNLKIPLNQKDVENLFKIYEYNEIKSKFQKIISSLTNESENIFIKTAHYAELVEQEQELAESLIKYVGEAKNNKVLLEKITTRQAELNEKILGFTAFERTEEDELALKELYSEIANINKLQKQKQILDTNISKFKFKNENRILTLGKLIQEVTLRQADITSTNVKGNQKSLVKYNHPVSEFMNLKHNKKELLTRLLELYQSPTLKYSNFLMVNGKYSLLKEVAGEIVLNEANVELLNYSDDAGVKNTDTGEGFEHSDYTEKDFIIKQLLHHINLNDIDYTNQFIPTPSDSKTTTILTYHKFHFTEDDMLALIPINNPLATKEENTTANINNYKAVINTSWFKAMWNTVLQEVATMETAFNVMFDADVYKETGQYKVKKEVLDGSVNLLEYSHYILENGEKVYVKDGKPTGAYFKFSQFYVENGTVVDFNDYAQGKIITLQDLYKDANYTTLNSYGALLQYELFKFSKYLVEDTLQSIQHVQDLMPKNTYEKIGGVFNKLAYEFAINHYLYQVEMKNLFGNNMNNVKNILEVFKRAKQTQTTKAPYAFNSKNEGFHAVTIDDVILKVAFDEVTLTELQGVETTDGLSMVLTDEAIERLKRLGKGSNYDKAIKEIQANHNTDKEVPSVFQSKELYYSYTFDPILQTMVETQIKNSTIAVNREVFKDLQLAELVEFMEVLRDEFGTGIQIDFKSSVKKGNKNVISVHDSDGNLVLTDEIKNEIRKSIQFRSYSSLGKVQETSTKMHNAHVKMGVQVSKVLATNHNNNNKFKLAEDTYKGTEIIEHLFELYDANIEESVFKLEEEISDENGNVTEATLGAKLQESGDDLNWDDETMKAIETRDGRSNMPFSFSLLDKRVQNSFTSLFTNNITIQKHNGYHAYQMPNMFMGNIIKEGKRVKTKQIELSSYTGEIDWAASKQGNTKLVGTKRKGKKVNKVEILVSRWNRDFYNADGTIKLIKDIDPKVLEQVGFRIPTEGKFSVFVLEVVGFLPDSMAGTVIVPDGFTAITGSDFDIDSIYVLTYNLDKDLNIIKYLTNKNSTKEERFEKFLLYKKALVAFNNAKNNYNLEKEEIKEEVELQLSALQEINDMSLLPREQSEKRRDYNKNFNRNLTSFYEIEQDIEDLIEELKAKSTMFQTSINDTTITKRNKRSFVEALEKVDNKLNNLYKYKTYFKNLLKETILVDNENAYKANSDIIKKQVKEFKKTRNEQLFKTFETYDEYRQNNRQARENRIIDIFKSILLNADVFDEIASLSEFNDVKVATALVNSSKNRINVNMYSAYLKQTSNIMENRKLKDKVVNYSNLLNISNVAKINSKTNIKYTFTPKQIEEIGLDRIKEFYGESFNEETNTVRLNHLGVMYNGKKYSDKNLLGNYVTNYYSKTVANVFDAVKYPMALNLGDYTIGVFSLFPMMGIHNYDFPTLFVSQGVVTELIKVNEHYNVGAFKGNPINEITRVRNTIYNTLLFLDYFTGQLSNTEATNFKEKKLNTFLDNSLPTFQLRKADKELIDKRSEEKFKISDNYTTEDLLNDFNYFENNKNVFNILKDYKTLYQSGIDETGNFDPILGEELANNYITDIRSKTKLTLIRQYLTRQLNILNDFEAYKKLDRKVVSLSTQLATDKVGAGPEIIDNYRLIKSILNSGLDGNFEFKIDGENALVAIYPKVFGNELNLPLDMKSAYKHLESKFIYSNLRSFDLLKNFFLIEKSSLLDFLIETYPDKYVQEKAKKEIQKDLLRNVDLIYNTDVNRILGVNTPVITNLDLTDESVETQNRFNSLSASNQMLLVKNQLFDFRTLQDHFLDELNYDDRNDSGEFYYHKIVRNNLKDKNRYSLQVRAALSSTNPYIREMTKSLILYTYHTTGFEGGNNMASIIPIDYLSSTTVGREIGLDVASELRALSNSVDENINYPLINLNDFKNHFAAKNHKDKNIVIPVKNVTYTTKNEEKDEYNSSDTRVVVDTNFPIWNEVKINGQDTGFIYINKFAINNENTDSNIANAKYVKVNNNKIYSRHPVYKDIVIKDKLVKVNIGYIYKDLNKLEAWENGYESIIPENNQSVHNENIVELYIKDLETGIRNQYTGIIEVQPADGEVFNNIAYNPNTVLDTADRFNKTLRTGLTKFFKEVDVAVSKIDTYRGKKLLKNITPKEIDKFTDHELHATFIKIGRFDPTAVTDLGLDLSNGFNAMPIADRIRLINRLIIVYKTKVGNTIAGISNNIRLPHKPIKELEELELLDSVNMIAEYAISRIAWIQQRLDYWTVNIATIDYNNMAQVNTFNKDLYYLLEFHASLKQLDGVYQVPQSKENELTLTQIQINQVLISLQEYQGQINNLNILSDDLYNSYIIGLIKNTTTNPLILADESKIVETIIELRNKMLDVSNYGANINSPVDTTNFLVANVLKRWTALRGEFQLKAKEEIAHFMSLFEKLAISVGKDVNTLKPSDYMDIFEKNILNDLTGKVNTIGISNAKFVMAMYLTTQLKNLTLVENDIDVTTGLPLKTELNPSSILHKGYIPAQAVLNKSKRAIIAEKLGYFNNFDVNSRVLTDSEGDTIKNVQQSLTNLIQRKKKIPILPVRRISNGDAYDETKKEHEARVIEEILEVFNLSFNSISQIETYNKEIDSFNKLITAVHGNNINYDLKEVIPFYIQETFDYIFKKQIEAEYLLHLKKINNMGFVKNKNIIDRLGRRWSHDTAPAQELGSTSNVKKLYQHWAHNNIYDDYNTSNAFQTRWGRVIQQYTSLKGLALNWYSGVNNIAFGSLQTRLHSIADGDWDRSDHNWGTKYYFESKALSAYFTDGLDNYSRSVTKQTAIIKYYDIMNKQTEEVAKGKSSKNKGTFGQRAETGLNAMFFFQSAGEHMMQNSLLFTMMKGARIKDNKIITYKDYIRELIQVRDVEDSVDVLKTKAQINKDILKQAKIDFKALPSLMDEHGFENGELKLPTGITLLEISSFKERVRKKAQRLHGVYNKEDINRVQKTVLGRWAMQFRKWMPQGWNKRWAGFFQSEHEYMESHREFNKGYYASFKDFLATPINDMNVEANGFRMSVVKLFSDYGKFLKNISTYYNVLSYEERVKVKQTIFDFAYFVMFLALKEGLKKLGDEDDELKQTETFNFTVLQLDRMTTEIGGYYPISIYGSGGVINEGKKLYKSPAASLSTAADIGSLGYDLIYGATHPTSKNNYFKTGIYSRQAKMKVHFIKLVPIWNQIHRWEYMEKNNKFYKLYQ